MERWMLLHSAVMLIAAGLFLLTGSVKWIAQIATFSFLLFFFFEPKPDGRPFRKLHVADLVTTLRMCAIVAVLFFQKHWPVAVTGVILLVALLADGLDGYLARRNGNASDFGAYFDAETDAFFVLAAGGLLYERGMLGGWILTAGLLRYVYFLLVFFLKPPMQKERRFLLAKIIAGILMGTFAACFFLPENIYAPAAAVATVLVCGSFSYSFFDVLKKRVIAVTRR
jgi:phosphatidylglycerophosphate synthase